MKINALQIITLVYFFIWSLSASAQQTQSIKKDNVQLKFRLDDQGSPRYSVLFKDRDVIKESQLGFSIDTDSSFYKDFHLVSVEQRQADGTWQPVWGEEKNIRNNYEELTIHLKHKNGKLLTIIFRAFADGLGFKYEFPKQSSLKYFVVKEELTEFNLAGDHTAFWIPGDFDSNEYRYTTGKLSAIDNRPVVAAATDIAVKTVPDPFAVQTPLMMKSADGLYINIHEAALLNYPAMQLHVNKTNYQLSARLVPDTYNNKAYLHAPAQTPWRTVLVSDKAADILASRTILNLNEPSKAENTSWIKPMKFVGVWWEYQTGKSTWSYSDYADSTDSKKQLIPNGRHGANTANVNRYIDFAAANGMQGVLVEGWNTGWEDWFGNWKENVFDFVTPYPDFDVNAITSYAKQKGISMIMHNETSGSATNYERQLDTAFRFMNQFGYPSVKTGYVGKIIPRGEYHDGQWMVNHYERVLQKGMQHRVTIDAHEPPRPTGLHRTYPNFMASEAGRGNEYNAFSTGSAPEHETILPFTRLMGGPMDYTPGIFKLRNYADGAPGRQMHSTLAKQLALYVTIYSPVQMVADLPENYEAKPDAFQFIKDVAVDWDDTKIIEAEPGDYITIARKEKQKPNWFIGAVTDEHSRTATVPLNFLDKNLVYIATIYRDATDANWKNNPEAYTIETFRVDASNLLKIKLAEGGGAAISIRPINMSDDLKKIRKYK
ncbi:glycoside hydrolase family 97 protein [Terrimonas sp. NA20]|uniref:Glycoside hydrolase family 97 protein n=1 Tax=Terrimonas ginsenosidimutans TaxID=2908004 RepID=A0ABS9KYL6_9BACT|nr:glycoside hydrolase family 97 protein [Terrimonas ginsenosidimutans]MCG2617408.1 glycoside hydrolase family 97 protein [Terrimonas ginsenosidimutans]